MNGELMKTERVYIGGEYVGSVKDRGGVDNNSRFAFCLPGGAVLFARRTLAEVRADIREYCA